MPDADDFDIESLRALLRDRAPQPEGQPADGPNAQAAPKKAGSARAKPAPARTKAAQSRASGRSARKDAGGGTKRRKP